MRAVLITMMILVHITYFGDLYPGIKYGILSFMMPAFLVITGYLVNVNKSLGKFEKYILQIFVPYAIMVTGFSILSYFLPVNDRMTELSVTALLEKIFITSIGPYWFLQTIMVCGIIYYAVHRLMGKFSNMSRMAVTALLFMCAGMFTPVVTFKSTVFYFIGICMRSNDVDINNIFRPSALSLLPFAFIVAQPELQDWGLITVIAMIYFFLSFLAFAEKYVSHKWVTYIGMNTLPIYLFHPIFTMAAKYYRGVFAFDDTRITYTIFTVILALCGSLAIAYVLDKTRLSKVFCKDYMLR